LDSTNDGEFINRMKIVIFVIALKLISMLLVSKRLFQS
jgi:hypothetical protein